MAFQEQALGAQCRKLCEEIQNEMRIYADVRSICIQFITSNVDDDFIYALSTVLPGASHGEAWSLPAFDAMCFEVHQSLAVRWTKEL